MTTGEKIRALRLERDMTQADLGGEHITRSMISLIESDKASPSLQTLSYLAEQLEVPLPYLLSDKHTLFFYKREECIEQIQEHARKKEYRALIRVCDSRLGQENDDETAYLRAVAHLSLAEDLVRGGSMKEALVHLGRYDTFAAETSHDTSVLRLHAMILRAVAESPANPLYAFSDEQYRSTLNEILQKEEYAFFTDDIDYPYESPLYALYARAKKLIREQNDYDAITLLLELVDQKSSPGSTALLLYRAYAELENAYRNRRDYENAYKYAGKKFAYLTAFKE